MAGLVDTMPLSGYPKKKFCPDEIHGFDLVSWILKNAENIPYENRVILRLLCDISLFSELCFSYISILYFIVQVSGVILYVCTVILI